MHPHLQKQFLAEHSPKLRECAETHCRMSSYVMQSSPGIDVCECQPQMHVPDQPAGKHVEELQRVIKGCFHHQPQLRLYPEDANQALYNIMLEEQWNNML